MRRYIGILLFAMMLTVSLVNFDYSIFCALESIKFNAYGIFLIFFWAYMLVTTIRTSIEENYL